MACFAAGGLLYAPYPVATPLGTAFGGPLTAWLDAQRTLLASAAIAIACGLVATALLIVPCGQLLRC